MYLRELRGCKVIEVNKFMYKAKVMLIAILAVLVISLECWAKTYYLAATNGNDSNAGTSEATPWKTIAKVNGSQFQPGDFILFKRGETWREQLTIPSSGAEGNPITFGAYGSGNKPLILGSVEKNSTANWINEGNNIWISTGTMSRDVGNLIFEEGRSCGMKVWNQTDLDTQGKFWYDSLDNKVKIYSTINPAIFYNGSIECAQKFSGGLINITDRNYVIIENIELRYCGSHGIYGSRLDNIIIRECNFSYIGGSEQSDQVRYGNGVELWGNAHDCVIEKCKLWEIYDAALTNQASSTSQQYNIYYRYNIIWNCEYSYEYWSTATTSSTANIRFENSICADAGCGWGHVQRPSATGRHLFFWDNRATTDNIYVRNNIFYNTTSVGNPIHISNIFNGLGNVTIDYNCYYNLLSGNLAMYQGAWYPISQFSTYQSNTGKDAHSIVGNPRFVDTSSHNYRLLSNSPCINAGTNVGLMNDYIGNHVPQGTGVDIGAFEYTGDDITPLNPPKGLRLRIL